MFTLSFRPTTGTRHLHRDYSFTGSLVETAPKSLRHSCRSELRVIPPFPEAQTIPSSTNQMPAFDPGRRFTVAGSDRDLTFRRTISRYGVKLRRADFPREYPFASRRP